MTTPGLMSLISATYPMVTSAFNMNQPNALETIKISCYRVLI